MRRLAMMPLAGLLLSGAMKAARVFDAFPVDVTLAFSVAVLVQCAAALIHHGPKVPNITPWVVVAFGMMVPAAMWAPSTDVANAKIVELFTLALLCAFAPLLLVRHRHHLAQLAGWLAAFGGAVALDTLLAGGATENVGTLRLDFAGAGNPLSLGRAAGTGIVVLAVAGARRDLHWLVASAVAAPLAIVLFRTASQGPALATLVGLTLVAFSMGLGRRRILVALTVMAVAGSVVLFGAQAASDEQRNRLVSYGHNEQVRLEMWSGSLSLSANTPHGIGWGGFAERTEWTHRHPHNVWIEALLEGGWAVGLLFAFVTVAALRRAWQATQRDTVALYALALAGAWVVNSAFTGSLPGNRTLLGLLTVAAMAPMLVRRGQNPHETVPATSARTVPRSPA